MPAAAVVFVFTGIIAGAARRRQPRARAARRGRIDLVAVTLFTGMVVELVADVQDGRRDASPGQLLRAVDAGARPADPRGHRRRRRDRGRLHPAHHPRPDPAHDLVGGRAGRRARAPRRVRRAAAQPRARARQRLAGVRRDPRARTSSSAWSRTIVEAAADSAGTGAGIVVAGDRRRADRAAVGARGRRPVLRTARPPRPAPSRPLGRRPA